MTSACPETTEEAPGRQAWRTRFALFTLDEMKPDVVVATAPGGTLVRAGGAEQVLDDRELVDAVNGRLPPEFGIDPHLRGALNALG